VQLYGTPFASVTSDCNAICLLAGQRIGSYEVLSLGRCSITRVRLKYQIPSLRQDSVLQVCTYRRCGTHFCYKCGERFRNGSCGCK
jgi:hypothetical protein